MVTKFVGKDGKSYEKCDDCGFVYEESSENWAQQCEDFCVAKGMCSTEIQKHHVEVEE